MGVVEVRGEKVGGRGNTGGRGKGARRLEEAIFFVCLENAQVEKCDQTFRSKKLTHSLLRSIHISYYRKMPKKKDACAEFRR